MKIKKESAYKAGEAMQIQLLRYGVTEGAIRQFSAIVMNHSNETLKVYIEGLLGIVND